MCAFSNVKVTESFLIRVWLNSNPMATLTCLVFIVAVVFSYALYVFEREKDYESLLAEELSMENVYGDYIWLTVITLMTVGYGDMYPTTPLGRFVAILISIGGLFLTATLIGLIN